MSLSPIILISIFHLDIPIFKIRITMVSRGIDMIKIILVISLCMGKT